MDYESNDEYATISREAGGVDVREMLAEELRQRDETDPYNLDDEPAYVRCLNCNVIIYVWDGGLCRDCDNFGPSEFADDFDDIDGYSFDGEDFDHDGPEW